MNCREFARIMGDHVNRVLGDEIAEEARTHLDACPACASKACELGRTSELVRSLDRVSAPAGFEARVKERLALRGAQSPASAWGRIGEWLRGLGEAPDRRRLILKPALAVLICVAIIGSVVVFGPMKQWNTPETDWAYIDTCRNQHASFAGANPLADESALALRERAGDVEKAL
jgi:hypothetical protein